MEAPPFDQMAKGLFGCGIIVGVILLAIILFVARHVRIDWI